MFVKREDLEAAKKLTALAVRHSQFVEAFVKGISENTKMSDEDKASRIKDLRTEAEYAKRAALSGQLLLMKMELNYNVVQRKKNKGKGDKKK